MKSLRLVLLLVFLITACTPKSNSTPTVISEQNIAPITTKTPEIATIQPTKTPTVIPTEEKSWPISEDEVPACKMLLTQKQLPSDYILSGAMLSQEKPPFFPESGSGRFEKSGLYRFDFEAKTDNFFIAPENYQEEKIKVTRAGVEDLGVSPNYQKAVYLVNIYTDEYAFTDGSTEPDHSWLEIYDSIKNERNRFLWKDEWAYIIGWVNNDLFAIRSGGTTLFLDSSGNIKQQFSASEYPDYSNPRVYNPDAYVLWGGYKALGSYSFAKTILGFFNQHYRDITRMNNPTLEVYSPTLEHVIYTEVKDRQPGIVLYDIETGQKVIEIITGQKIDFAAFGGAPVWSPDGKRVLMLLPTNEQNNEQQNLHLLDISGKIEQLLSFEISGPYSWSPSGEFIAFWMKDKNQIGVVNLENKDLKIYCVSNEYFNEGDYFSGSSLSTSGELFWLPGERQILIEISKTFDGGSYDGIGLVDLEKALFIELKWNAEYPAWLEK